MNRTEILQMLYGDAHLDTVQKRFDAAYVTAVEVQDHLQLSRACVLKKLEAFPCAMVGSVKVWERTEELEKYLWDWTCSRIRKGEIPPTDAQLIRMAQEKSGGDHA